MAQKRERKKGDEKTGHASGDPARRPKRGRPSARIAVIMGSDSDLKVMADALRCLRSLGIAYEARVVSAHRTPEAMVAFAREAAGRGIEVIIAAAGGAAHLPGMVAACTLLPVIGVPVALARLDGLDSLLSIAQMPKGVPVATMAIDGAVNAALFAARVLGLRDPATRERLEIFARQQADKVRRANKTLKA
jgi:5-(carboxyamino)imidazole ribonucleotide mutase